MHYWALRIHQRRLGFKKLNTWMKWAYEDGSWILILGLDYPYLKLEDDWPNVNHVRCEGDQGNLE